MYRYFESKARVANLTLRERVLPSKPNLLRDWLSRVLMDKKQSVCRSATSVVNTTLANGRSLQDALAAEQGLTFTPQTAMTEEERAPR